MNRETSVYLDLLRFLAAVVVFLSHVSGSRFTGGLLWQFGPYGTEAVDIFFVLSGFVIAYVADRREHTATDYMISRAARIYSVALPALIVTLCLDAIGRAAHPDLYAAGWGYVWDGRVWQFISGLFFLNQLWFLNLVPGSDLPYWSLGFEVWYYVLFGLILFAPRKWRMIAVVAGLLLVGPKIAVMFPIWLLGVACYHLCKTVTLTRLTGWVCYLGGILGWIGYEAYAWHYGRPATNLIAGHSMIIQDYLISILFAVHLVGFRYISGWLGGVLLRFQRPIRWVAGATFTMYLFHLPIAQFLAAEMPWQPTSWATRAVMLIGTPALIFVIAEFTERRKDIWRHGFSAVVSAASRFAAKPQSPAPGP